MTEIDTRALALRVADDLDEAMAPPAFSRPTICFAPGEARALAAFLREAVSPWRPIDDKAHDGRAYLVCRAGGSVWEARFIFAGPRAGKRWESYGLGRLPFDPEYYMEIPLPPPPPARIEDAEEPSHDRR